ncbi:NFACT RNA binding domain-containing protein [Acidithiobacillus sp. AMEEHan]|uniref:NFACT RNA binding domain-containing protein n=1 Tax=Acidithiobacillus sp. AMEEHan TaxID=2994951 RepID=UPI0027E4FEBA|nr:NFACT RNA binding domain-containing protein [Acidithiobacillus sp. AMEEHan]
MDTLQIFAAARCLQEDFVEQSLRGVSVEGGRATLHFARKRLLLAYQAAPLGLYWSEATSTVPKPAGPAALLGQKLAGFRLLAIAVPWADRIVSLSFRHVGLDRQERNWTLIAECFGGRGALLLLDENLRIHWSSRWDSLDQGTARILPQAAYQPPTTTRHWEELGNPLLLLHPARRALMASDAGTQIDAVLHGPPCAGWWQSPGQGPHPLGNDPAASALPVHAATYWQELPAAAPASGAVLERAQHEREERRLRRRLQRLQADLARWQSLPVDDRRYASALFALPDRVHSGGPLLVPEYLPDGIGQIELDIPAGKLLHDHARELLRRAQRAQRAQQRIHEEIVAVEKALATLPNELPLQASISRPGKEQPAQARRQGIEERVVEGFTILWGKNARANEYLTFRLGRPQDLWLHVQDLQGSHVLIRRSHPQQVVPAEVLRAAAEIALQHSDCQALSAEVDWTELRHVSRHPQGGQGRVLYRQFQTLRVRRRGSGRK